MDVSKTRLNQLLQYTHDLAQQPELGWNEEKTSQYIQKQLGVPFWSNKTALVYRIGDGSGPAVLFRAELDALQTPHGTKHVCGHHAHMSALMCAYQELRRDPPKDVTIYVVFQPCEEGYPSGATFVSESFLASHPCSLAIAFHTFPGSVSGQLSNPIMAGADYVEVMIEGKSTHIKNKYTHEGRDVMPVASTLVSTINSSHFDGALLNIGTLVAGETPNSIAGKAKLTGDIRFLTSEAKDKAKTFLYDEIENIRKLYSEYTISIHYHEGYPLLHNDETVLARARKIFSIEDAEPTYATEDFSLYPIPKLFLFVSTGSDRELHDVEYVVPHETVVALYRCWCMLGAQLPTLL